MSAPAWLLTAREHLRQHYPADGLAESILWTLHAAGFDPDGSGGEDLGRASTIPAPPNEGST